MEKVLSALKSSNICEM